MPTRFPYRCLRIFSIFLASAALLAAGCKPIKKKGEHGSASGSGSGTTAEKVPPSGKRLPSKLPPGKHPPFPKSHAKKREMFAGAHILIGFKGASRSKATRTKEEALKLATEVAAKAKKDPSKFAALAKKHSEGPSGKSGGDLGEWPKGRMVPAFDKAVAKLKVGEVSDPVLSPFGYHVIMRKAVKPLVRINARMILIPYKGSLRAPPNVTRSADEAKKLADKVRQMAIKNPKSFEALVKKYSEGPGKKRGGLLPPWSSRTRHPLFRMFTGVLRDLKENEIAKVVKSPFGYHVLQRMPKPPIFAGAHVLIAYKGAMRAGKKVTRSKDEAKKLAAQIAKQLKADPKKFEEVAATKSDGPSAARGGRLGKWPKGRMVPAFDKAIEKLKIGQISGPVESPFGFHVIQRLDPAKVQ